MALDLNAVALFVKVVENKSFTLTAKRLDVPISTVSRKVSELEKSLGVRLLERSTRQLRLTDLGREYYENCQRGLEEIEAGTLALQDKQSEVSGTLRLSAPPNLSEVFVAPIICAFQEKYPKVKIKVFVSERNLDFIEDGVDVALRVGDLKDSNLIARELIQYRHQLVAAVKYLDDAPALIKPEQLYNHRCITFNGWFEQDTWKLSNAKEECKVKVDSSLTINDFAGIEYAVRQGHGVADMPSMICHDSLQKGRFIEVLPEWKLPKIKLSIVYANNRHVSRVMRLFLDFSVDYLNEWSETVSAI